jgi:hypothetical protein
MDARQVSQPILARHSLDGRVLGDELGPAAHQVRGRAEDQRAGGRQPGPAQQLTAEGVDRGAGETTGAVDQVGTHGSPSPTR